MKHISGNRRYGQSRRPFSSPHFAVRLAPRRGDSRPLPQPCPRADSRLEIVKGNISDRETVRQAMKGVTHVLHCATCKETPDDVMDVTVKGLFWLLEECRASASFSRSS